MTARTATASAMFLISFSLVLFELVLTRLFGVVLFATFAHLALAIALMGISIGALMQHLWPSLVPDEGLEVRLGWLSLGMGAVTVLAVMFTLFAPITIQFEEPPESFTERSAVSWSLVHPVWFGVLMPVLATPFAVAGLAFAGAFQHRKTDIGLLYGSDLVGGGVAAIAFVPLLYVLPGPDVAFVVAGATCLSAWVLFRSAGLVSLARATIVPGVICGILIGIAASGTEVIGVRYAAGYSEERVTYTRWTPLTRLAVHEGDRGHFMLLDNTSASEIVRTAERREALSREVHRGLVYQYLASKGKVDPSSRVAILAASAGPEVAVAQSFGFEGIEAIDIAPEIGDVVAERYPDNPYNPYLNGDTERVVLDGRAAILHSDHKFDVIQMVHANLHSSAGQLANAWSPALLETREAFVTYLGQLEDDGILSFGRGSKTKWLVRSAMAALSELGVKRPASHVLWVSGSAQVMLVKRTPWTAEEVSDISALLADNPRAHVLLDPTAVDRGVLRRATDLPVLTDNQPYLHKAEHLAAALGSAFDHIVFGSDEPVEAVDVVYHTLGLQILFVLGGGLLLLAPMVQHRVSGGLKIPRVGWGLAYVACLGYGYLAVETVLLHELVLFVGHPTYAIAVVILAMLLFSGIGAVGVGRLDASKLTWALPRVLGAIVILGALQAWVVPEILYSLAFGLPIFVRVGLVFVVLAPLGLVMGVPFPLALRILRPEAAVMVPWAWALNGWTSVVASLGTVLISRMAGYNVAFGVALLSYALAILFSRRLSEIGAQTTD